MTEEPFDLGWWLSASEEVGRQLGEDTNSMHAELVRRLVEQGVPEQIALTSATQSIHENFEPTFCGILKNFLQGLVDCGGDNDAATACGERVSEACQKALDSYSQPATRH